MRRKAILRDLLFADGHPADRYAGLENRLLRPRDKRVPPPKIVTLIEEAIGTGLGEPPKTADITGREFNAVGDMVLPVVVVRAPAGSKIEQLAGQTRDGDFASIFILELDQTALPTAVAERFPFRWGHLIQGFGLPKRLISIPRLRHIFERSVAAGPFLLFCRLVSWHSTGG